MKKKLNAPWMKPSKIYVTWFNQDEFTTSYDTFEFDTMDQALAAIAVHTEIDPNAKHWVQKTRKERVKEVRNE